MDYPENKKSEKTVTIVGFGNSITEAKQMPDKEKRWLNILKTKLTEFFPDYSFRVINSGVGGNSAREAMARFDKDVKSHCPDYLLLEFGGNNNDPARPERRVPVDEFKMLLERVKESLPPRTKIIVITFPPVFKDLHAYWTNPKYKEYLEASQEAMSLDIYINITREFAGENGFPLFDLHKTLLELGEKNGREKYTLNDGVHLTEQGNKVLAEGVFAILKNIIPVQNTTEK